MNIRRRHRPAPYIPFITLADIAWQIIIFFLVASTFVSNWSLNVPLPSAGAAASAQPGRMVRVEASESSLKVNGMAVPLEDLELQLAGLLAGALREEDRAVVVVPADDLSFQRNADIFHAIQQAGGIVFISQEKPDEDRAPAN